MIFTWRGIGAVALIIPIIVCLGINIVTSRVFDEPNYFQGHLWPKLAALGISGFCCGVLGLYVNSKPPRIEIDEETGREIEVKPYHSFMFIKLEYWAVVFVAIGLVVLFINLASK